MRKGIAAMAAMAAIASMGSFGLGGMGQASPTAIGADAGNPVADQAGRTPIKNRNTVSRLMDAIGLGFGAGSRGHQRRAGPGWTNAHARRVASKARNVKRHRANSKG